MQDFNTGYIKTKKFYFQWVFITGLSLCLFTTKLFAQDCPPNLDFETGTFSGWTCYSGNVEAVGIQNIINLYPSGSPVYDQHTMYVNGITELDPYGGFPVNCPNGSGHSIKLGNNQGGGLAEGISYEFTIPANRSVYNLIYHYAVVFQDPNHQENEQPSMEIEIRNVTDNYTIDCSSFTFRHYGSPLPGFRMSSVYEGDAPVWYKDWSAVSINLNDNAGKKIRLTFKTADCTFRRHFGYAYIDVNSECSDEFVGASFCPGDTALKVTAPFGYQQYKWYDDNFSRVLGSTQTLNLDAAPPSGTTLAVELVPYNGYGCLDTLYAILLDTMNVSANAGPDKFSCNLDAVQLGTNSRPGWVYQWQPATGLSNPNIANPFAAPNVTTQYTLTTSSVGGGCRETDEVVVQASVIDNSIQLKGKNVFCIGSADSAVLFIQPTDNIQWFNNNIPIIGANGTEYEISQTGLYHAALVNNDGCEISTDTIQITIDKPEPGIIYPIQYALTDLPLELSARQFGESVFWSPGHGLNSQTSFTPLFNGEKEEIYTIEITTLTGCITIDTQVVKIIPAVEILVPTAFTPNGDGLNDLLRPITKGVKEVKYFRVYNRWGYLMFEAKNNEPSWDGTLKGIPQPSQAVVWVMEGIGVDGRPYARKGTCVLIR